MKLEKPKTPRIQANKLILTIITITTALSLLTLHTLNLETTTLTTGLILTALIDILIYQYRNTIQLKIAKANEYKEWRTGKKTLDKEAIEKLKQHINPKLEQRLGELQAKTNTQQQKIQELQKRLTDSTEVKTKQAAQQKHRNQTQKFKENAYQYNLPHTQNKEIQLFQKAEPGGYIGKLQNIWKKENKLLVQYDKDGETQHTKPIKTEDLLPRRHAEHLKHSNALPLHLDKNGEFKPPIYIKAEG